MPFGDTSSYTLEICCSSIGSALLAAKHGADRIELCQNLERGGITPSYGLIKEVVSQLKGSVPVHVLIGPRPGDFRYSLDEVAVMQADIEMCKELGCAGVVVGRAGPGQGTGVGHISILRELAGTMEMTYNRRFDDTLDLERSLDDLVRADCRRVLTSGGAETVVASIESLAKLVKIANGRISIMVGAGIAANNVKRIIQKTGVREVHASCKRKKDVVDRASRRGLFEADEFVLDTEELDKLVEVLQGLELPGERRKTTHEEHRGSSIE